MVRHSRWGVHISHCFTCVCVNERAVRTCGSMDVPCVCAGLYVRLGYVSGLIPATPPHRRQNVIYKSNDVATLCV